MNATMNTDPQQIRADVDALLVDLPDAESGDVDIEMVGRRLDEAHQVLVRALESVEKG